MFKKLNFVSIFIFTFALIFCINKVIAKCEMTYENLDECTSSLHFFNKSDYMVPKTLDELKMKCDMVKGSIQCLKKYTKTCLSTMVQTALVPTMQLMKENYKKHCVDENTSKEFLENIQCLDNKEERDNVHNCRDGLIGQLNYLTKESSKFNKEDKMKSLCCTFASTNECMFRVLRKTCPNNFKYIEDNFFKNENLETVCGDFMKIEHCSKNHNQDIWMKLKAISDNPKGEGVEIKYKQAFTALLIFMSQNNDS